MAAKTRKQLTTEVALRVISFIQHEFRRQIAQGEDPQYADATNECFNGVCDMIGACANDIARMEE